ncbi:pyridoxamine-phosphate oxidase [Aspergillus melleus]|uniref:Pyridoxamine-phosphate oxidase n=1 Tax=Aspergillus melleus TaxID=138277 RepID=A0ACC3AS96_9EURO|nr:pyridoxamine-phosphate oxidase [Aspergillus melleus]
MRWWYWVFLVLSVLLAAVIARPLEQDAHLLYQSDIGEGKYYSTSATDAVQSDAQPEDVNLDADNRTLFPGACPNGWRYCGVCNGTKCKVKGVNYPCTGGTKCTKQSGGGDGKPCGSEYIISRYQCPGGKGRRKS